MAKRKKRKRKKKKRDSPIGLTELARGIGKSKIGISQHIKDLKWKLRKVV